MEISQIQACQCALVLLTLPNTVRVPLLDHLYMKAASCSPLGSPFPHLRIFSGRSLTQVQLPAFFVKPILHLLLSSQVFRLRISSLMNFHSSSVSMEIRSPPWLWQVSLFQSQYHPSIENMYQEFLKVMFEHPTK